MLLNLFYVMEETATGGVTRVECFCTWDAADSWIQENEADYPESTFFIEDLND